MPQMNKGGKFVFGKSIVHYVALLCRNNKIIESFNCDKMYIDAF